MTKPISTSYDFKGTAEGIAQGLFMGTVKEVPTRQLREGVTFLYLGEPRDIFKYGSFYAFTNGQWKRVDMSPGFGLGPNRVCVTDSGSSIVSSRITTSELDSLDDVKANVQDQFDSLTGRMTTAESDIDSLEGRVTPLENRMDKAESDIHSLDNRTTSLEGRVTVNENSIVSLDTRMDSVESRATSVENRVTKCEVDVRDIQNELNSSTTDINVTINEFKQDTETRFSVVEGRVTVNENDIDALENRATSLENRTTSLETRMTEAEGDIDELDATKQDNLTGAVTGFAMNDAPPSRAIVSDASGKLVVSNITSAEIDTLDGIKGNIQQALDSLNQWVASIGEFHVLFVDELPDVGEQMTIYFVPSKNSVDSNVKDEFMYVNGVWEQIGSTAFTLTIAQDGTGITINGTVLQDATATQDGLMTAQHVQRLGQAETDIDNVENRCTSLETRMTTAETDIDNVENRATSLEQRVTTAETDIDNVENRCTSLETRVTTNEGNITNLTSRMETAETDITNVENRVATTEQNITNLQNSSSSQGTDISGIQSSITQINQSITNLQNGKQDNVSGGASTITSSNLTANRALVSNGSGKVAVSAVTSTELGYLDGVTSGIQSQINAKLSRSGGTMTGILTADNNTSYSTKQVRNITISTSSPSGGSYGDIWIQY